MPALFKRQKAIGVTIRGEVHATLPSPDCQQERNVGPFLPLVSVGHTNGVSPNQDTQQLSLVLIVAQHVHQIQSVLPQPIAVHLTGWLSAVVLL
jgi:hypothetical protein